MFGDFWPQYIQQKKAMETQYHAARAAAGLPYREPIEVCPDCDIAGCRHIRARRAALINAQSVKRTQPQQEPDPVTNQELAIAEFRDASAAVRLAFSARDQAREAQIIANRRWDDACKALQIAQDRQDRADDALRSVDAEAKAPADIDASRQPVMNGVAFIDERPEGNQIVPDPA